MIYCHKCYLWSEEAPCRHCHQDRVEAILGWCVVAVVAAMLGLAFGGVI